MTSGYAGCVMESVRGDKSIGGRCPHLPNLYLNPHIQLWLLGVRTVLVSPQLPDPNDLAENVGGVVAG